MWPFSTHTSYTNSGVLRGATDWHCHLLPGVDDGVQTQEEALRILLRYCEKGFSEVWITPHVMEDFPNTPEELRLCFDKLCQAWEHTIERTADTQAYLTQPADLKLHLAAEHMIDILFQERLEAGQVLPIGVEKDMILVETSYYSPPIDLWGAIEHIKQAGYYPLLAHPERYQYMERQDYERLRAMGVRLQLNMGSLLGMYGSEAKRRAELLLKQGFYTFKGTDTHNKSHLESILNLKKISKSCLKQFAKLQ